MDIMQNINVSIDGVKNGMGNLNTSDASHADAWLGAFDQALDRLLKSDEMLKERLNADLTEFQKGNSLQSEETVLPFWMLPVDLSGSGFIDQSASEMNFAVDASVSGLIESADSTHLAHAAEINDANFVEGAQQGLPMQPFPQISLQMRTLTRDVTELASSSEASMLSKDIGKGMQQQEVQSHKNIVATQDVLLDESLEASASSGLFNQTLSLVVSRSSNEQAITPTSMESINLDLNRGQVIEQLSAANSPNVTSDEFGQETPSDSLFLNIYQDEVPPSVYDQDWQEVFHSKLLVYVSQKLDQVHIKLHPEEMGPVDIKLSYQQNEANLTFMVHHAETKEMLLASQEKLKELFQYQGLQLGSFDVHTNPDVPSHQSFSFDQEESQQKYSEESSEWPESEIVELDLIDEIFNGQLHKPRLAAKGISVWV